MIYTIPAEYESKSVKQYIQSELKLSGKMITRLKKRSNGIMLNGKQVTVRALLKEGDSLFLAMEQEDVTSDKIRPVNIPLDILFEDEYYMIFNKRANMPTHPSHDHYEDTLANGVSYLYSQRNFPFVCRAVNRLDRDTSGVVVFAKTAAAANAFSRLQQSKLITKKYIALLDGVVSENGSVKGFIRRKPDSIMLREFLEDKDSDDAAFSHTDYTILQSSDTNSVVELILHTGRTHQIRVHMAHIGHPVSGDGLYGSEGGLGRHMLHAAQIIFIHPFTEKQISVTAPLPDEFIAAIRERGIQYDPNKHSV